MADIRHLKNRHDVIFLRGQSDLDKSMQTGAEWHADCDDTVKSKSDIEFQYGGCLDEFSVMSSQSHVPHCRVKNPSAILKIVLRRILFFC